MKSRRKGLLAVGVVGAGLIALAAAYAGDLSLWYAKRQAWERISNVPPREKATLNVVLLPEVRAVPAPPSRAARVAREIGGYRFTLPAAEFRLPRDPNDPNGPGDGFDGAKITIRCTGIVSRTPDFKIEHQPTEESVRQYLRKTDPYDLVVDIFNARPAAIRTQATHADLQKLLYLLLLKSAYQPVGSERLFQQFRTDRRDGILAGDQSCEALVALIYLPETRQFAELVIGNKGEVRMDDVYRCLGLLKIEKLPGG